MLLKNGNFKEFSEIVKNDGKKIIIYGAGMVGQIIVPYLVDEYDLSGYLYCFVDSDKRKNGKTITVCNNEYDIKSPEIFYNIDDNYIIMITNSKFLPVVNFLDSIENLNSIYGYIIPMMQVYELEHVQDISINRITAKQMIPKTIHYCWFGGKEMSAFLKMCIASWRELCPDYQIIEWNENNYDVKRHSYTFEAYKNKKYGFVTDLARLDILYEHGGIYLDTDVTLLKNLDDLLYQPGFIGTEKWGNINSGGGCGFIKGHPMLKRIIDYRDDFHFQLKDGSFNIETNGMYETKPFLEAGFKPNNELQIVKDVTIYPSYVNHPYDYMSCSIQKKEATVAIHHFFGGWMEEEDKKNRENTQKNYIEILNRINQKNTINDI